MSQRIFRIFISSTFSDYAEERTILHKSVFPKLSEIAARNGMTFEPVDLRWGIPEAAQSAHSTLDVCLEEIRRCKELSPKPNFVVMLGNRYGWEPARSIIPNSEMSLLRAVANDSENEIISTYYLLDTNQLPDSIWCLKATEDWTTDQNSDEILSLIRKLVRKSELPTEIKNQYFRSATHHEIVEGLLGNGNYPENVCVYIRNIQDLDKSVMDLGFRDSNLQEDLYEHQNLTEVKSEILDLNPTPKITSYSLNWNSKTERESYLASFSEQIFQDLSNMIIEEATRIADEPFRGLSEEGRKYAEDIAANCFERENEVELILSAIENAFKGLAPRIILVNGETGVGKTSVIAKVIEEFSTKFSEFKSFPVFVEQNPENKNLDEILGKLENETCGAPAKLISASERMLRIVSNNDSKEKLVVIDGIDKLNVTSEILENSYLPIDGIPASVILLGANASSLPTPIRCECQEIEIRPLGGAKVTSLVQKIMSAKNRSLSEEQLVFLKSELHSEYSGLYAQLLAIQLIELRSWEKCPVIPQSETGLIARFASLLSRDEKHGEMLVKRALAYLAGSRNGLSETEIQEALGIDRLVIDEFYSRSKQDWNVEELGILPPIIWSRLRQDLSPYLTENFIEGTLVLDFKFPKMKYEFKNRYVSILRNMDIVTHGALAYVFRPYESHDNWDRLHQSQGLDPKLRRSLSEMSYHLKHLNLPEEKYHLRTGERELVQVGGDFILDWIFAAYDPAGRLDQFLTRNALNYLWDDTDYLACIIVRNSYLRNLTENSWFEPSSHFANLPIVKILSVAIFEAILGEPAIFRLNARDEKNNENFASQRLMDLYREMCESKIKVGKSRIVDLFKTIINLNPNDKLLRDSVEGIIEISNLIETDQLELALEILDNAKIDQEFLLITKWFYFEMRMMRMMHLYEILKLENAYQTMQYKSFSDARDSIQKDLANGKNPNSLWLSAVSLGQNPKSIDLALECITSGGTRGIDLVGSELLKLKRFSMLIELLKLPHLQNSALAAEYMLLALWNQYELGQEASLHFATDWLRERYLKQAYKASALGSGYGTYTIALKAEEDGLYRSALHLHFEALGQGATTSEEEISRLLETRLGIWSMNIHWLHRRLRKATFSGIEKSPLEDRLKESRNNLSLDSRYYPSSGSAISIVFGKRPNLDNIEDAEIALDFSNQISNRWSQALAKKMRKLNTETDARVILEEAAEEGDTWAMVELARYCLENESLLTAQAWIDLATDYYDSAGIPFIVSYCLQSGNKPLVDKYMEKWSLSYQLQQADLDSDALSTAFITIPRDFLRDFIALFVENEISRETIYDETILGRRINFQKNR